MAVLEGAGERTQGFGWFNIRVMALLVLALITDSYDLQASSFAAPTLAKVWNVPPQAFAPLFGAGLAGVFFGAPLFGWFGDRFGRKKAIVLACALYGVLSLACTLTTNPTQFAWLRFLMGLGFGGALPNVVALSTELAPAGRRGMMTALIFVGMPLGGAIPGFVAAGLVPSYGWEIIFIIGGLAPIVFALLIAIGLPESPAFLAARTGRAEPPAPSEPPTDAKRRPLFFELLSKDLVSTTLLFWLMFAAALLTIYLVSSWLPLVLTGAGLSPERAALLNSYVGIGGACAGLVISLVIDRIGLTAVVGLFLLACASVIFVAYSGFKDPFLTVAVFASGFSVVGVQYALNVSAGLIYPAHVRSSGVGWAFGIGRIGSVTGALVGGLIVGSQFAGRNLFLLPVVPLLLGGAAAFVLMRVLKSRAAAAPAD